MSLCYLCKCHNLIKFWGSFEFPFRETLNLNCSLFLRNIFYFFSIYCLWQLEVLFTLQKQLIIAYWSYETWCFVTDWTTSLLSSEDLRGLQWLCVQGKQWNKNIRLSHTMHLFIYSINCTISVLIKNHILSFISSLMTVRS